MNLTTPPKVRNRDGAVHFSDLKKFAKSPLHYAASCARGIETTRAMLVGTIVHHLVLGPSHGKKLVLFEGEKRAGGEWKDFVAEHPGAEIATAPEWRDAEPIAAAVLADPVAARLLANARRERELKWSEGGIECATGGVDFHAEQHFGDLKVTHNGEPEAFQRHAFSMGYHAQIAFYRRGLAANDFHPSSAYLIGVEDRDPYAVTVLEVTEAILAEGEKCITKWLETLRVCDASGSFPGYAQGPVPWEIPPWMSGGDEEGEEAAA